MSEVLDPIVGCYVLHLYCTSDRHGYIVDRLGEFTGANKRASFKEARSYGWSINEAAQKVTCPQCNNRGRT